jgi:hypothetical protein
MDVHFWYDLLDAMAVILICAKLGRAVGAWVTIWQKILFKDARKMGCA